MFIELTDHLRCPADHEEQFLVLLPELLEARRVSQGRLGCPVCGRTFPIEGGVADLGGAAVPEGPTRLLAATVHPLLGLEGPGGVVGLVGGAAGDWRDLRALLDGVQLVAVNPPVTVTPTAGLSVLLAPGIPLKRGTLRGVVLGPGAGGDPAWVAEAARVVLPGLRVVGEGPPPAAGGGLELLGSADGVWVARRGRA